MRGPLWKYPDRKRCYACRQYFAWTIIDGLYDSRECAGLEPLPVEDPSVWPRQHYTPQRGGGRKAKVAYPNEEAAEKSAVFFGKQSYLCEYCDKWHIGGKR